MFISPPNEAILNCESSEFFSVLDKPPGGQARDCYIPVMSRPPFIPTVMNTLS